MDARDHCRWMSLPQATPIAEVHCCPMALDAFSVAYPTYGVLSHLYDQRRQALADYPPASPNSAGSALLIQRRGRNRSRSKVEVLECPLLEQGDGQVSKELFLEPNLRPQRHAVRITDARYRSPTVNQSVDLSLQNVNLADKNVNLAAKNVNFGSAPSARNEPKNCHRVIGNQTRTQKMGHKFTF